MIIGIDVGSTSTKIVSIEDGKLTKKIQTVYQWCDDVAVTVVGTFEKFIQKNEIKTGAIEQIKITGVGASKISDNIFGIPAVRVSEIGSIGIGGMFLSGMNNIVITNIGTGTVIIEAGERGIFHFGGSGVGGGTILGLAKKLLPTTEFDDVLELAKTGKLENVDLLLGDITDTNISFLNEKSTASNFAKMLDSASSLDVAIAILNMVYQVVGVLSVFAARAKNTERVIVTGNGSKNQIGRNILADITSLYGIEFIYPDNAEYATAVGAGLSLSR